MTILGSGLMVHGGSVSIHSASNLNRVHNVNSSGNPGGNGNRLSVNQIQKKIERGQAPKTIKRADKGKIFGEQDHIHFDDGSALKCRWNLETLWKDNNKFRKEILA